VSSPPAAGPSISQQNNPITSTLAASNVVAPFYVTNRASSPPVTNLAPIHSLNFLNSSSSYAGSSPIVITIEELSDIQNALRLLEVNPNAIPTVESSQYQPTTSGYDETVPYSTFGTLFTNNQAY
jgi:hypothetical protein